MEFVVLTKTGDVKCLAQSDTFSVCRLTYTKEVRRTQSNTYDEIIAELEQGVSSAGGSTGGGKPMLA